MSEFISTASVKKLHFLDPAEAGESTYSLLLLVQYYPCFPLLPSLLNPSLTPPPSPGEVLEIPQFDMKVHHSSMLVQHKDSFVKVCGLVSKFEVPSSEYSSRSLVRYNLLFSWRALEFTFQMTMGKVK